MTTLAALVAATPAADRGVPTRISYGAGEWRIVVELADPGAGASVAWFDITCYVQGWENGRGADQYAGRYRASVVNIDLEDDDDTLAPWNPDTAPLFGVHVPLGPGLIMRAGFIHVVDDTVVDWLPRWTNRVERWGDASYGLGRKRRFPITARDLLTALVGVPIAASSEQNWSERVDYILTQAGWAYGSTIYGATFDTGVDVLTVPARPASSSALAELAATLDPAGLCYFTDRTGRLIVRPSVWDTFHTDAFTAGADGTPWGSFDPVMFNYYADDDAGGLLGWAAYAHTEPAEPFGFPESEDGIINHVKIVGPGGTFDDDDPISIQRYERKSMQASWIADNDQAAADILTYRADAIREAAPLYTSIDLHGFMAGPATVDYLDPVAIDHQTAPGRPAVFGNGWVRQYIERAAPRRADDTTWELSITVDIYSVDVDDVLLPVEDLAVVDVTDTSAEFSWTNPAQTITPTHTQIRLINPTSLWGTVAYPITGIVWGGLEPSTVYEFQVRLIRMVDGIVTHVSPTRSVTFITDPTTVPDVDVDDGDIDVDFPPPDPGCVLEWELQSATDSAGPWTTVDSDTITVEPFELIIPDYPFDPGLLYRVRSREVCAGVPGPYDVSNLFVGSCSDPPALGDAPFTDADLRFYWPAVCPPDVIIESLSEDESTLGPVYAGFVTDGDGNTVVYSNAEGYVAWGLNPVRTFEPGLGGLTDDATLAIKVQVAHQPVAPVVLFGAAGLWIEAVADGAVWKVRGRAHEEGAGMTTITAASTLAFGAWYDLAITHDTVAGDLRLYVDGIQVASALGTVTERHNPGLYESALPDDSLITNCAVWARVLAAYELPGFVGAPPTVTINQSGSQPDPATGTFVFFDIVFSEAVAGFAAADVTLAGTASPSTAGLSGTGPAYTLAVSGMTGPGTVVASIPANVATAVATGLGNAASTSTDNTVTWSNMIVVDTFTRANSTTSPGTADSGQTYLEINTDWGIGSNQLYQSVNIGGGGDKFAAAVINSGGVNRDMSIDVVTAQTGNSVGAGLWFRYGGTGVSNFFSFFFYRSGGGALFWFLQKKVAGADTTLASGTIAAITGTLRVDDDGSTIDCYVNGVLKAHITSETALNTNTYQGPFVTYTAAGGANSGTGWVFDNYMVGP
jgi:hypothetical protein